MAGLGRKVFTAGEVLTAANVQNYLQDQAVMVFAGTAARSSAIGTASEGMISYLADTNAVEKYTGAAWESVVPSLASYVTLTGAQTLTDKTLTSAKLNGAAQEAFYGNGSAFAGYTFYATTNGAAQGTFAGNATANGAINITSTAAQTLNTLMATGQSMTVTLVLQNGATAYYPTSITVDGSAPTVLRWSGGTAPTAGSANAWDVYTFTLIKLGSPNWLVLASVTKFA